MKIEQLVLVGLSGLILYRTFVWLRAAPRTPDPWDKEIEDSLENAPLMCPHCLNLQEHNFWFCPECGSTVGQFSNYLPGVYPYSVGETVRAGIEGRLFINPLVIAGYTLLAFSFLSIIAPIYLLFLFGNLQKRVPSN